jgi:hypothetical protein
MLRINTACLVKLMIAVHMDAQDFPYRVFPEAKDVIA